MKKIIAFAGSNKPNSINHQLILAAAQKLPQDAVCVLKLTDYPAPLYSECLEIQNEIPSTIQALYQIFTRADGFIIASPEHNGLVPAFFKNTIDWLSRINQKFLGQKPVLLMSTSPGQNAGSSNLKILKTILPWWGAGATELYSLPFFPAKFDLNSKTITDPEEDLKLSQAIETYYQEVCRPPVLAV